jgi:hypothetical protein
MIAAIVDAVGIVAPLQDTPIAAKILPAYLDQKKEY